MSTINFVGSRRSRVDGFTTVDALAIMAVLAMIVVFVSPYLKIPG